MNIDELLAPISEDAPCGENLEYDKAFLLLEQAQIEKNEQQFGDVIIPAEPPNWVNVEKQAAELLRSRTKDIRVITALMRSWVEMRGIFGFADGLGLLRQTLERYWEEVWPRLEFEGELDPLFRLNALADIEDGSPLVIKLQYSTLLESHAQKLTFREACSLLDGTVSEISGFTGGRPRLLEELKKKFDSPEIAAVTLIRDHLTALLDIIRERLSAGHMPEVTRFLKHLNMIMQFSMVEQLKTADERQTDVSLSDANAQLSVASEPGEMATDAAASAATNSASRRNNSSSIRWYEVEINSRDEAQLLLEKARKYFMTHEPSHPAPMMIQRIQRLIALDFLSIVNDLAPEGLNQLSILFGSQDNPTDDAD
ncbi:MAG: type VI secretion system protein TssA [Enterobacteriaceae bacterium]|jgi:type VI secretion system protein ImpA|nr:type VI secretion system protein TssA [Enterobacteriaceae bacterium]